MSNFFQRIKNAFSGKSTDHHERAKQLSADHAMHKDVLENEPHDHSFAAHIAKDELAKVEGKLHDLAHETDNPDALNVISQTPTAAADVAKGKIQDDGEDASDGLGGLRDEDADDSSQEPNVDPKFLSVESDQRSISYEDEMKEKIARGRKAFGKLIKAKVPDEMTNDPKPVSTQNDDDIAERKARFSKIVKGR